MQFNMNDLFGNNRNKNIVDEPKKKKNFGKAPKRILIGIVVAVIAFIVITNCYFDVSEQQQAVVTMFGQVQDVKSAGLYFKIPFLQQAHLVDTTTHGMAVGYTQSGSNAESNNDASMITSDFNFVNIDFYIEYRVSDPVAYLYAAEKNEDILYNVTKASIRSTVINYSVDDVITTAKSQIQSQVRESITAELDKLQIGLQVVNVSIQDAEPPTEEVIEAFKNVETAKQGADTAVNNAKQYQSEQIPAAEAKADKIEQDAQAKKAARIAEAEGQVERFNQMYEEYAKYPLITRQRLYYEAIEQILPGVKIIITDGDTQTMLPLDSFTKEDKEAEK